MYRAMLERDPAFDGLFFVCVRPTGVFCRPTCHARNPRRANVEFVATAVEAQRAGYRPCHRCQPLESPAAHPTWALDLIVRVRAGEERLTDQSLRSRGLSPPRVRRYFQRRFGMTFQTFQRSQRMGQALRHLSHGQDSLGTGFDCGYESSSGFRAAFVAAFGVPPGRASHLTCLVAEELPSPLRPMLAVASEHGICIIEFLDRRAIATELRELRRRFRIPIVPGANEHLDRLRTELGEYFGGTRRRFEVSLDLGGTAFQRRVWSRLREIPFGDTVSYSQIAKQVGRREAVRAVGQANGHNPAAIVVPCHRVVRTDGSLCGYGGGLWRKRWLLQHERDALGSTAAGSAMREPRDAMTP
jgi:AraC family transcriptional regulator of adaptative response/methylated-DNA-[protein]-cysteine methyltransferase